MAEIVLRNVDCDEEGVPKRVTLSLPVDVLARVARVLGKLSPNTTTPPEDSPACSALYHAATFDVFNRWWEDGIDEYFREARRA